MAIPFPDISPNLIALPAVKVGALTLGPFAIRWYALGYIAGILLGWRYAAGLVRNARLWGGGVTGVTAARIDDLILWLTLGIILGGRLGYVLFYMLPLADQRAGLAADPWEIFKLWDGGMSFHGGLIGVGLAVVGFAKRQRISILALGDIVAACGPIGIGLVRVANFINGELWGRVTDLPWGMVFCSRHVATYANGACVAGYRPRHPSQLYETALEGVVLFVILRLATHRALWLRRRGAVTGLFLLCYGVFRVSLENVRMPDFGLRDLPLGLTVGMLLSAPMIAAGAWLIVSALRSPVAPYQAHESA